MPKLFGAISELAEVSIDRLHDFPSSSFNVPFIPDLVITEARNCFVLDIGLAMSMNLGAKKRHFRRYVNLNGRKNHPQFAYKQG